MIINNMEKTIKEAQKGNKNALTRLLCQFNPLLKRQASYFRQLGLEYDDAYQQGALYFILGIYQYQEIPPVTFAGYIKKRVKWGLWAYWRKQSYLDIIDRSKDVQKYY